MIRIGIVFIVITSFVYSNGKPSSVDKQIVELSLNYQFDEAEELLQELFEKSDELKNYYLKLNIELIKSIRAEEFVPFKNKRSVKDSVNKVLIDYSENVIEKFEDQELSLNEKFYLGSIYGMLGRFHGVSRSWYSAFSSAKSGKNILNKVIEEDPNFIDAYLVLGMMDYYSDRLGGLTRFFAGILGLSGDREKGLEYLNKVEKEGELCNWFALMTLAELYSRLENNKFKALTLLEKFHNKFPNNSHFANWYSYEQVELYKLKEAGKIINGKSGDKVSDMVKGNYFHHIGNYQKSNSIYDTLLAEKGIIFPWVYEKSKFNQAINYLMLNDITSAKKISNKLNENYSEQIKNYFNFPKLAKQLVGFRTNLLNNNASAIEMINKPPDFKGSKYFEAFYYYYLGIYYYKKNNLKTAESSFYLSKNLDSNSFNYSAISYLIIIYSEINVNRNDVKKLLSEIDDLDYEEFEFSARDLEKKYNL